MTALDMFAINGLRRPQFVQLLGGIFEHSPWVAEAAWPHGPFADTTHLHKKMVQAMHAAPRARKLALLRAHPELAGKAMVANALTADSLNEQTRSGLTQCSAEEFAALQGLNRDYNKKFGWPFILAVKQLDRATIIARFSERLQQDAETEFAECLRNIEVITGFRLQALIG
jgi:OHCU decarboxylase